jgi:hypothetical protein
MTVAVAAVVAADWVNITKTKRHADEDENKEDKDEDDRSEWSR